MSGEPPIEGFEAPIHRALVEPILLGGAPRSLAIVNGTAAAALGLGLQQWLAGLDERGDYLTVSLHHAFAGASEGEIPCACSH